MSDFDLAETVSADEAEMVVKHPTTGEVTTWVWTFYGPGHPLTVTLANRIAREMLRESKAQQEARINGKKWKGEDQTIDEIREKNADSVVARLKGFTPVKMGGNIINFSPEEAKKLLLDRKMGWLFSQVMDFLAADESFMKPSANG